MKISISANFAIGLIWSLHLVGFLAMQVPFSRHFFEALTPFNLLLCSFLAIKFQETNRSFWIFFFVCFFDAYFLELAGVQTGQVFGKYAYLENLGFKIADVPIIIGINWFLLVFSIGNTLHFLKIPLFLKILLAAFAMTLSDFFIEPVAIEHRWWHWFGQAIPFQNYVAWFFGATFLMTWFYKSDFEKQNPLASHLWAAQMVFFCLHFLV